MLLSTVTLLSVIRSMKFKKIVKKRHTGWNIFVPLRVLFELLTLVRYES
jgi:hypothetical protein